mmetsp:Transcript_38509/g.58608  ORF Transcript_38509/g.58608 Transcript_38509/m.58608 type:complete len:113 (-) Transcript_38509:64-402(-)
MRKRIYCRINKVTLNELKFVKDDLADSASNREKERAKAILKDLPSSKMSWPATIRAYASILVGFRTEFEDKEAKVLRLWEDDDDLDQTAFYSLALQQNQSIPTALCKEETTI